MLAGAVLLALAVVIAAIFRRPHTARQPGVVSIVVAGHKLRLAGGTTLGQAAARLRLRPHAGNLLDVDGELLRRGAFPGSLLLNHHRADPTTPLRDGDLITLTNGHDRREQVNRTVLRLPAGIPSDPQFTLSRSPGEEQVSRGALSHKLVAVSFHPDGGPAKATRAVALTFDDGPSPQFTPRLLATLRRLHVPATFFVIGYLADQYPGLVRAEARAGMTVGNHSYNHPEVPPFDQLPPRLIRDEIALGAHSLRHAGVDPMLFRPPAGSFSPTLIHISEHLGERIVLWSVDPHDWQTGATASQISKAVLTAVRPGSIIDLHDGGGDRTATLAALPEIIRGIRNRHLRLVALTPP